MNNQLLSSKLSNGLKVYYPKRNGFSFYNELRLLEEEIPTYFTNGISLNEGDTIVDVGANIGLFTIYVHQMLKGDVDIYSFEPIPAIFEALELNIQSLINSNRIRVLPYGISQESRIATFDYYPNSPGQSSMYPDSSEKYRTEMRNSVLQNLKSAPRQIRRLLSFVPPFLRPFFVDRDMENIYKVQKVKCQLKALSEVIQEQEIKKIDLLKIDVERSELDVLLGIKQQDWPKVKQVVVEVHDREGQLDKVKVLLQNHGFSKVIIEQEPFLRNTELFTVFGLRPL